MSTKKLSNGYNIPSYDRYFQKIINEHPGGYQTKALTQALYHVDKFELALDIGAHIGLISVPLAFMFKKVICFEACCENAHCLRLNQRKFNCKNIDIKNVPLGAKSTYCDINRPAKQNSGNNSVIIEPNVSKYDERFQLYLKKLDSWSYRNVDFIKVDVPEMELDILTGSKQELKNGNAVWMIACITNRAEVTKVMKGYNYKHIASWKKDAIYKKV